MDETLTFESLDGVAFAAQRGRLKDLPPSLYLRAGPLGPFLELTLLSAAGILPRANVAPWLNLRNLMEMETALRGGQRQWTSANPSVGFFRTSPQWQEDDTAWVGFCLAAQKAAIAANFSRPLPAQFAAAMGELVSNIHEHSGSLGSGIAAYSARDGEFEFVVADSGIGVLESLRTCPDYSKLTDHGRALQLALTEGISRFGPKAGRGHGFRPIFVGLANLNGSLRFRSGDHALVIDGQNFAGIPAKLAQKVNLPGFFASVTCCLKKRGK